jgi:exonuclease SbcC
MVSVGMRSNLLILDEPTDGFSKEQLGNVREVLEEVGSPQVIIVSHDKELESFADQIFKVEKIGNESTVSMP